MVVEPELIPHFLGERLDFASVSEVIDPSCFFIEAVGQKADSAFLRLFTPKVGENLNQHLVAAFACACEPQRTLMQVAQFVGEGPTRPPTAIAKASLVEQSGCDAGPRNASVTCRRIAFSLIPNGDDRTIVAVVETGGHGSFLGLEREVEHLHAFHEFVGGGHVVEVGAEHLIVGTQVEIGVFEHIVLEPLPIFVGVASADIESTVAATADDVDFDVRMGRKRCFGVHVLIEDEQFAVVARRHKVETFFQRLLRTCVVRCDGHFNLEDAVVVDDILIDIDVGKFTRLESDSRRLCEASEVAETEFGTPSTGI